MAEFKRGIRSQGLMDQLAQEAWWADVLNDPQLFVAVRDDYLNVYWRGHSLFRVDPGASCPKVTTHPKYLLDPELSDQVPLVGGLFEVKDGGLLRTYEGRGTLDKMKRAADAYSEPEKKGCHEIILKNPNIIDCEIALPGSGKGALRADLLSLEPDGGLVFWEAKHFTNGDLRTLGDKPPVCEQVELYRKYLSDPEHCKEIQTSYELAVKNLVSIDSMRQERRLPALSPLREVANGNRQVNLGTDPKVGLIIFGFDKAQREDQKWKDHHLKRLKEYIKLVIAAGDAQNVVLK